LFENNKRLIIEIAKRNGNPVLVVERNHRGAGIVEPFPRTSRLLKEIERVLKEQCESFHAAF